MQLKIQKPAAELIDLVDLKEALRLAVLLAEKGELIEARQLFLKCFNLAKANANTAYQVESIIGLLRLAAEILDDKEILFWDFELDQIIHTKVPVALGQVWYCKGAVALIKEDYPLAQRYFLRFLKTVKRDIAVVKSERREVNRDLLDLLQKAWISLGPILEHRGKLHSVRRIADALLAQKKWARGIKASAEMLIGRAALRNKDYEIALSWFQRAYGSYLSELNWFGHLHVLLSYARVHRLQQNYVQAYWNLELVEKAAITLSFEKLKRQVKIERSFLEQDAVDLLIDSKRGIIKTKDSGQISLRKQYILLNILEALTDAYQVSDDEARGLSKAEIIQKVWKENYRPEVHDNKLYYNINRLRKLIEPDTKSPQYLLNWKEGYRLAPGLKVQLVSAKKTHIHSQGGGLKL